LSADVPASGACWEIIQVEDDGTLSLVTGPTETDRATVEASDLPATDYKPIWAIVLSSEYGELEASNSRNDFWDLRFAAFGISADASDVTYTPAVLADWDYLDDPGFVNTALDQLAARTADLEALSSGNNLLPYAYKNGLILSNGTDSDHDINISIGECRDSGDNFDLALTSVMTKQLDASWAAGSNAGGLFSGSIAVDTWYHVFLIRRNDNGYIDAGFDTDVNAANIPAGYSTYRRIGSVLTNGSANILAFTQLENQFIWSAEVEDYDGTIGTVAASVTLTVPPGVNVDAEIYIQVAASGSTSIRVSNLYQADIAVTTAYNASGVDAANTNAIRQWKRILTNTSAQIRIRASASSTGLAIYTNGWKELW